MNKHLYLVGALALSFGSLQASGVMAAAPPPPRVPAQQVQQKPPTLMSLSSIRAVANEDSEFAIFGSYIGGVAGVSSTTLGSSGFFPTLDTAPAGTLFDMSSSWGNGGRVELAYSGSSTSTGISLSYEYFAYSASRTVTSVPLADPNLYPSFPTNITGGNANFAPAYEGTSGRYHLKYSQIVDLLFVGPALVAPGCSTVIEPAIGMRGFFIHHDFNTNILSAAGPTSTSYSFNEHVSGVGAIAELFVRQSLIGSMESFSFGLQAKPTLGIVWGHHKISQGGSQSIAGGAAASVLNVSTTKDYMHALVDAEMGLYGKFATSWASFELSANILGEFWPSFSYLTVMGPAQPASFGIVGILVTLGAIF